MMLPVAILLMSIAWTEAVSPLSIELARTDAFKDRAADMMGMLKIVDVTDRNYKNWWTTFTDALAEYEKKVADQTLFCSNWAGLLADLNELMAKVNLVQDGLSSLVEQLEAIKNILENATIGEQTGLHCDSPKANPDAKPICDALKQLHDDAAVQQTRLDNEKQIVADKLAFGEAFVCKCEYNEWVDVWTVCSKTCKEEGGQAGTQTETREIKWEPRNNGDVCLPAELHRIRECSDVCCPINCVLKPWEEWGVCPDVCWTTAPTIHRRREVEIPMSCGGHPCDTNQYEEKVCGNPLDIVKKELHECNANLIDHTIKNTELAAQLCNPNPCHNGAICHEGTCTCATGFTGVWCETVL